MARPKKDINPITVLELSSAFCTIEQMATILHCSADTLTRNFAGIIKEGRATAKRSLLKKQFDVAMGGNVTMLIWLGKQHLEQSEKIEQHVNVLPTTTRVVSFDEKEQIEMGAKLIERKEA